MKTNTMFPVTTKVCSECNEELDQTHFPKSNGTKDGLAHRCTCCKKRLEKVQRQIRRYKTLVHYSQDPPSCALCGEDRIVLLAFDHINGGGNEHYRQRGCTDLGLWLYTHGFPEGFRVLCHNCNFSLGAFGKEPDEATQDFFAEIEWYNSRRKKGPRRRGKLTDEELDTIREKLANGKLRRDIIAEYGLQADVLRRHLGVDRPQIVIDYDMALLIKQRIENGERVPSVAADLNVAESTVHFLKYGKRKTLGGIGRIDGNRQHGNRRLTRDQENEIRQRLLTGEQQKELAKEFGVHRKTIQYCCGGNRYLHILTDDQLDEIRERLASGETQVSLAKEYGVSRSQILRKIGPMRSTT